MNIEIMFSNVMRIKVDDRGSPDGQVVLAKKYHLKRKIVEVFFPGHIDHLQQYHSLQMVERFNAELGLAALHRLLCNRGHFLSHFWR